MQYPNSHQKSIFVTITSLDIYSLHIQLTSTINLAVIRCHSHTLLIKILGTCQIVTLYCNSALVTIVGRNILTREH